MSKIKFYFADHTYLVSYFFIDPSLGKKAESLHEQAKTYLEAIAPSPIIITDFELMRVITKIFRESGNNHRLVRDLLRQFFRMRIFRWDFLPDDCYERALAEFQSSNYNLDAEFLDLTSFIFINENLDKITGVLAFHDHFREASSRYGFRVIT